MKPWYLTLTISLTLVAIGLAIESPVPYSVHIFLVPPIVQAKCGIGTFWYPEIACSVCFCLTGGLSRCGPRPGCDPNDYTTTTTTEGSTGGGDVAVHPGGAIIGITSNTTSNSNTTVAATQGSQVLTTAAPATVTVAQLSATTSTTTTVAPQANTTNSTGFRVLQRKSRSPRPSIIRRFNI